jgi:hypothetical protein
MKRPIQTMILDHSDHHHNMEILGALESLLKYGTVPNRTESGFDYPFFHHIHQTEEDTIRPNQHIPV